MSRLLIETEAVVTGGNDGTIVRSGALEVNGRTIEAVYTREQLKKRKRTKEGSKIPVVRLNDKVAVPGFVQTHIHLCQTNARGTADGLHLMDWLTQRIFPYEASLTPESLRSSVRRGLRELLKSGTTCIMDMGTIRHTEVIAEELLASGMRAYFGKCLMDVNTTCPDFREETAAALKETIKLAETWHGGADRLRYAWTPRFILCCTDDLMKEAHALLKGFPGTRLHTHASENPHEMEAVKARCGMGNVEYLDHLGVVTEETCLAHCVHLSENEIGILERRRAHVLHCPSSNLKLASGIADIATFLRRGISVSLGADGAACNNTLDIWAEMRLASLLQKPKNGADAVPAKTAFDMATVGGARALGWDDTIGSLEARKAADLVFVDLHGPEMPETLKSDDDFYSALVYSGHREIVTDVMIDGRWVVRNRELKDWT